MNVIDRSLCLSGLIWIAGGGRLAAQLFCTPGSVWYHDRGPFGYSCYDRAEYVGDTLVEGIMAQRLVVTGLCNGEYWGQGVFTTTDTDIILHVDGDMVRSYSDFNSWDTLYYFGSAPGDQWRIPNVNVDMGCSADAGITVLDTGHMVIQGLSLRYLAVDVKFDDFKIVQDTIVERIGAFWLPLRLWTVCVIDAGYGGLRCFSDYEITYTVPSEFGCASVVGVDDVTAQGKALFRMEGDHAVIELPTGNDLATVTLFDVTGRVVGVRNGTGRVTILCSQGMNVLVVTSGSGPRQVFRAVVP